MTEWLGHENACCSQWSDSVRLQCLDYAMRMEQGQDHKTRFGIYGGFGPLARKKHEPDWLAGQEGGCRVKWGPQPKPRCGRPDCNKDARMYGYCMNHGVLLDRNGTPYTQDEVAGMREANRQAQEMDAALATDGPVIVWQLHPVSKIQVAVYIDDPHAEREAPPRTPVEQERHRVKLEQQRQRRLRQRECTDPELLARTEI